VGGPAEPRVDSRRSHTDNRRVTLLEPDGRGADALRNAETLPVLLHTATRAFVDAVDGIACAISRRVGDVLIQVAEHARDGRTLVLGHGYLIADFPLTQEVLDHNTPLTCSLLDDDCDPAEAELLREVRLDSLLMLPLSLPEGRWGLAEIYVNGRVFSAEDVAAAQPLAQAFGEALEQMPAPASRP
jgi:GAF domain-containing protein